MKEEPSRSTSLFFYRDQNAVEVDFLVDRGAEVVLIEAKAAEQPDLDRLNFAKVRAVLAPGVTVACVLACMIAETRASERRDVTLANPLHVSPLGA